LKLRRVFVDLMDSVTLFQTVGSTTEKALSPDLVRVHGTMKSMLLAERTRCRAGSLLADAMDSLRYTCHREHDECHLVLDPVSDRVT